jgi:hypothetical protein
MSITKSDHPVQWIKVGSVSVVWAAAQRDYNEKAALRIADEFDPDMFGVITVTLPNGHGLYHCIDGQHRVGAVRHLWGENELVPCTVLNVTDPARAAAIFDKMNSVRSKPQPVELFKVRVTAGYEGEVAVDGLVRDLGYRISQSTDDGTIRAAAACMLVYHRHGLDTLRQALLLIYGCWGFDRNGTDAGLIKGFSEFVAEFGKGIDGQRVVDRVSKKYTPGRLLGAAKSAAAVNRKAIGVNVSDLLFATYNLGRGKKLEPGRAS